MPTRTQRRLRHSTRTPPTLHPPGRATRSAAAAVPGASGRATTPRQALPSRSPRHPCSTHGCRRSLTPPSPCGTLCAAGDPAVTRPARLAPLTRPARPRRLAQPARWAPWALWARGAPWALWAPWAWGLRSASTARVGVGEPPRDPNDARDLARRVTEQIGAPDPQVDPPEALQRARRAAGHDRGAAHRGVARPVRLHGDEHAAAVVGVLDRDVDALRRRSVLLVDNQALAAKALGEVGAERVAGRVGRGARGTRLGIPAPRHGGGSRAA